MHKTPIILTIVAVVLLAAIASAPSIIYGNARPAHISAAPALTGQISQALATSTNGQFTMPTYGKDYTLQNTKYFDGNSWVVTTIKPLSENMNRSLVVLQKQSGVYTVVLGPGSAFPRTTQLSMPGNLAAYLNSQGVFYDAAE
jgi:hypothetical protein